MSLIKKGARFEFKRMMKQLTLRGIGLLGVVIFIPLFLLTFLDPNVIERSASQFVSWKLESETISKIDSIQLPASSKLEQLLGSKVKKHRAKVDERLVILKQHLKDDTPALIAAQIAKTRNLDCECRKRWEQRLNNLFVMRVMSLETAKQKLADFTQAKYMQIVKKLTLDVRIFLGANAFIFIFLLMVSLLRPRAVSALFLPAGLMLVSTVICSYFYLFEQNWFYTIIYNNYVGYGYIGYLGIVFLILCDIAFFKARVTRAILEMISHVFSSLTPC